MADLFSEHEKQTLKAQAPLAVRMRPRSLDEFAGQEQFIGPGKLLRRMIEADRLTSVIFYGPPGTGKTTLAEIIASLTVAAFEQVNAASIGVKEIREILDRARSRLYTEKRRTVLFIDELHRFNKSQQDVLLNDVEDGIVLLIGATTENPFFAVNSALVSRSQIFRFETLTEEHLKNLINRALADRDRGLGQYKVTISNEAVDFIAKLADGDARRALTALEVAVLSQLREKRGQEPFSTPADEKRGQEPFFAVVVDLDVARESIQQKALRYDKAGDEHYDHASAFIKSMRGSDPDAAVYWLARMLASGEDPRFIARRMVILAAEDIGNAHPMALVLANTAAQAVDFIGLPEAQLILSQAVIYLACAPKSNASSKAIWSAMSDVENNRTFPVPVHLRDAHYKGAEKLGHGKEYQYDHNFPDGIAIQDYLGVPRKYFEPSDRGHEVKMKEYLDRVAQIRKKYQAGETHDRPQE
jgi:putative ATPase